MANTDPFAYKVTEKPAARLIEPYCEQCGSGAVQIKHWAEWHTSKQHWVIVEEVDDSQYYCTNCDCDYYELEWRNV